MTVKDSAFSLLNQLLTQVASRFVLHPDYVHRGADEDSWMNFGPGPDFRQESQRRWKMRFPDLRASAFVWYFECGRIGDLFLYCL